MQNYADYACMYQFMWKSFFKRVLWGVDVLSSHAKMQACNSQSN